MVNYKICIDMPSLMIVQCSRITTTGICGLDNIFYILHVLCTVYMHLCVKELMSKRQLTDIETGLNNTPTQPTARALKVNRESERERPPEQ